MKPSPLKVTRLMCTPVFVIPGVDEKWSQVYGAMAGTDLRWYFPAFFPVHRIVLNDIEVLQLPVEVSDTAQKWIHTQDAYGDRIKEATLPDGFEYKTDPYDHQREGLLHAIYNMRAALFYACGLGKTKIVIDWQRATGCWPLIVCPKVVLDVWPEEAGIHGIGQEYTVIDGYSPAKKRKQIAEAPETSGCVVTYGVARRYKELLATLPYSALVADESHYLQTHNSGQTKAVLDLAGKAPRRLLLSGTPSLGDPRDVYAQLRLLSPCFARENYWHFTNKFCTRAPKSKHIIVGFKNLDVVQRRLGLVALRRKKEDCLDLPPRTVIDVAVPLGASQQKLYRTLLREQNAEDLLTDLLKEEGLLHGDGLLDVANAAILVGKLLQVTGGFVYKKRKEDEGLCDECPHLRDCIIGNIRPHTNRCVVHPQPVPREVELYTPNAKLDALLSKLRDILVEPTHKVIIWANFTAELDFIEAAIAKSWKKDKSKWTIARLKTGKKAKTLVDRFNNDPRCRVYLAQVKTGVGITLNAANYMIYYALPWELGAYDQSRDRNHRAGQTRNTTVYRLLGKDTVDEHVARALTFRADVAETLTTAIVCAKCPQQEGCKCAKIYDAGCKYQRSVARPVTRVREL